MLSKFLVIASGLTLASATARQSLCSSENTGSNYTAVTNIYQSISACALNCGDDYSFAVLQDSNCWCTNSQPVKTVDISECSTHCPGYPDDSCGNSDKGLYSYITSGGASDIYSGGALQSSTPSSGSGNGTSSGGNSTSSSTTSSGGNGTFSSGSPTSSSSSKASGTSAAGKSAHLSWAASALALGASVAFML